MKDFLTADINELLGGSTEPAKVEVSADEYTRQAYLEDVARLRDFTPDEDKMLWPKPIGPKWKN